MSFRMDKVNKLLKQELSKLIHEEFAEEYGMISVTYINTTADLKTAQVGISILNESKERKIIDKLNQNKQDIRFSLGDEITLKNMPEFTFLSDKGVEKVMRIEKLLDKIKNEK